MFRKEDGQRKTEVFELGKIIANRLSVFLKALKNGKKKLIVIPPELTSNIPIPSSSLFS